MAMTLYWFQQPVSQREQAAYAKEEGWFDAMRDSCMDGLAHKILMGYSLYRRIDPPSDDPFAIVYHQWSVGVETDMDELKAREKQIDEGRRKGRDQAAEICLAFAKRYRNQTGDGMCKWVIAGALEDAAKAILT